MKQVMNSVSMDHCQPEKELTREPSTIKSLKKNMEQSLQQNRDNTAKRHPLVERVIIDEEVSTEKLVDS